MIAHAVRRGHAGLRLAAACASVAAIAPRESVAQANPQARPLPLVSGITSRTPRLSLLGPPSLTIGSADGAEHTLLNGVISAIRRADGGLVVGDAGNDRLLFFDPEGRFVRSVGRRGDGPAEFRLVRSVGECADGRIFVQDGSHLRLSLFDPSGELAGSVSLPAGANFDPIVWCAGAGDALILLNQLRGPVRPGAFMTVNAVVVRVRERMLDTIAAVGTHEYYIGAKVSAMAHVPMGSTTLAAGSRAGAYACVTVSGRCLVFDTAGQLEGEFVVAAPRRAVSARDWTIALESHLGTEPSAEYRAISSRVLAEIPMRPLMPRFDRIVADDSGRLWVRTLDQYGDSVAQWVVLSRAGRPLGIVLLPRRTELIRSGETFAIGVARDVDGVERVQLFTFAPFLTPPSR